MRTIPSPLIPLLLAIPALALTAWFSWQSYDFMSRSEAVTARAIRVSSEQRSVKANEEPFSRGSSWRLATIYSFQFEIMKPNGERFITKEQERETPIDESESVEIRYLKSDPNTFRYDNDWGLWGNAILAGAFTAVCVFAAWFTGSLRRREEW